MPTRRKKEERNKKDAKRENVAPRVLICPFCQSETSPDYKSWEDLGRFVSDRGRIFPRSRTGLCAKHQRHLTTGVKRARHLSLLPFAVRPL